MTETRTNTMPSRRAVTKAAAWSAPVIAAAVAAPMAAASGGNSKNGHIFWNPQISTSKQQYSIGGVNVFRIWADTPGAKAYKAGDQWTIDLSASNLTVTAPVGTTYPAFAAPYAATVTVIDSTHLTVTLSAGFSFSSTPNFTDVTFPKNFFTATPTGTFSGKISVAPTTDNSLSDALQVTSSVA